MTVPVLLVEHPSDAVAIVTLNRPDRRNALSIELLEVLCQTFETLAGEPRRRAVILRGAGPVFCAGLDLVEAAEITLAERSAGLVARLLKTVLASPLVTVAAVQGGAYAGGGGLMAACDFVAAAEDARFAFPEVRRGLLPALISVVLRGRVRDSDLRELFLLAEPIDARRALEVGLVNRVVPSDRLLAEAQALAATTLLGAPEAIRRTKRLLRSPEQDARLFNEAIAAHEAARLSDEAQEGIAAFREHRPPSWQTH
jgi:methylglutaconyl-CoA hydratase